MTRLLRRFLLTAAGSFVAGCAPSGDATRTSTESGGDVQLAPPVAVTSPTTAKPALHLIVAGASNEARYRVRERLMGKDFDNDAIGVTRDVTGGIALDSAGVIIPELSRFVVHVGGLTSDSPRRDGFVRGRVLEAELHPEVIFAPTSVKGLSRTTSLDAINGRTFQLLGNLTVKGVTRPSTWNVTARREGTAVSGTAATAFTFAEFGISQPRVPILMSVSDTIKLEYDFSLATSP